MSKMKECIEEAEPLHKSLAEELTKFSDKITDGGRDADKCLHSMKLSIFVLHTLLCRSLAAYYCACKETTTKEEFICKSIEFYKDDLILNIASCEKMLENDFFYPN